MGKITKPKNKIVKSCSIIIKNISKRDKDLAMKKLRNRGQTMSGFLRLQLRNLINEPSDRTIR